MRHGSDHTEQGFSDDGVEDNFALGVRAALDDGDGMLPYKGCCLQWLKHKCFSAICQFGMFRREETCLSMKYPSLDCWGARYDAQHLVGLVVSSTPNADISQTVLTEQNIQTGIVCISTLSSGFIFERQHTQLASYNPQVLAATVLRTCRPFCLTRKHEKRNYTISELPSVPFNLLPFHKPQLIIITNTTLMHESRFTV